MRRSGQGQLFGGGSAVRTWEGIGEGGGDDCRRRRNLQFGRRDLVERTSDAVLPGRTVYATWASKRKLAGRVTSTARAVLQLDRDRPSARVDQNGHLLAIGI